MQTERQVITKADRNIRSLHAAPGRNSGLDEVEFKVRVSGDLCHRSGYVQNDSVKNLGFAGSTSKAIRLTPGAYSLTVFVGAAFGRTNVDYAVELITNSSVPLHVPGNNPIRAKTVGITGFVVIDFTLS